VNGIHDLGGMHGFGRVQVEAHEPVFHAKWEGRVFAMANLALGMGVTNLDGFRHGIERLPPVTYLTAGYYGRWLAALETLLAERGIVEPAELEGRLSGRPRPTAPAPLPSLPPAQLDALRHIDTAPRFEVGQAVRACNRNPRGHTRLPRYVRGKRGVVARVHPAWVFPDTNAHGLGEHPQFVYAVRFSGEEIGGTDAEPNSCVHVDLFESYLQQEPE
jgi:nitrile hydratase